MSLLCYKNCRETAMLLGMPTDQLLKKKVFNGQKKKEKLPQEKSDKLNSEMEDDPPYSPWDDEKNKDGEVFRIRAQNEAETFAQPRSSWGRIERTSTGSKSQSRSQTNDSIYDSDECSHINLYSREVMDVMNAQYDHDLSEKEKKIANSADDKNIGLLDKLGRGISSLLKRSDMKKAKDEPAKKSRAKTNGYDGGESASDTQSNVSVPRDANFWSIHYDEREHFGIRSPTFHSLRESYAIAESNLSSVNSDFSTTANNTGSEYGRSSLDSGHVSSSLQNDIQLNRIQRGRRSSMEYATGMDTRDGLRRMHCSTTDLPFQESPRERSLNKYWSEQNIMREITSGPRGQGISERNERQYASADKLWSSGEANMRGPGTVTNYGSSFTSEPVKRSISSSRIESITSTPRRNRSEERLMTKNRRKQHSGRTVSHINDGSRTPSNKMESDMPMWSTSSSQRDMSSLTLNVDFDYRADSSRLYVILKSMHGLPPKDRTIMGKTNVRVHLVVMPERVQRAYSRRKHEGWTIRFMEKFRFSDINTLNSIAFKVVLNDGSAKERLIGTKTVHMKGVILSKGKQSFAVEMNPNINNK